MPKATLLRKEFRSNQTRLAIDLDGVTLYRCITGALTQTQENNLLKAIEKDFKKVKKEKKVKTAWGDIPVIKKQELEDFVKAQKDALDLKIKQLGGTSV